MSAARRRVRGREATLAPAATGAPDLIADIGREQFAAAMDASCALFRGLDAIRGIQQRTARETSMRHSAAARDLRAATAPLDWFSIQLRLWQGDLDAATRGWQSLADAALETQAVMLGCAGTHLFDSEGALETVAAVEALEALPGAAPVPRRRATVPHSRRART